MKSIFLLACTLCCVYIARGYNILAVFPVPSRSHNTLGKGIVDALLDAGHQVTWATSYPPKEAVNGLNVINLNATWQFIEAINWMEKLKPGVSVRDFARNITRTAIATPALRDAIVYGSFDAVITESFYSDVDAGYAAVMKVPWIVFSSVVMTMNFERQLAEVYSLPTVPIMYNRAFVPMSFFDRVYNSLLYGAIVIDGWLDYPTLVSLYKDLFGPLALAKGVPLTPFHESFYNVSILFINSHPSYAHAMSLPPNVVEIGGFHIKDGPAPPLPKDLQKLLDSATEGAIYFSMGSILKSSAFPANTANDLLRIFSELPYTVLWKFEGQLDNLPKNVHIRSWMPQSSILAHPNVKLFISHGGLLSMLESLYYGIPLLLIPVYADQPANAIRAVSSGYALQVSYDHQMSDELKTKLEELMSNDSYYKTAKYVSKVFRSRPLAPTKLIPYYVELAIESQGAFHLRSKSQLYSWYQRCMLDQALAALTALYVIVRALKAGVRRLTRRQDNTLNKDKIH